MSGLPSHIEERFTDDGRAYYVNHKTHTTTWEKPTFPTNPPAATNNSSQLLPPGWEARVDPNSQRTFYIDHANGKTQWEFPVVSNQASVPSKPLYQSSDFSHLTPSTTSPSGTPSSWHCNSCGYSENLAESSECIVCGKSRNGGSSANNGGGNGFSSSSSSSSSNYTSSTSSTTPTTYNCSACTLQNDIASAHCTACNTARPSEFDSVVTSMGIAASKQEEVAQLPGSCWELDPPELPKKDEPKVCQHPSCDKEFGVFQRTHHCRSCGQVVCSTHSAKKIAVPGISEEPQRVCDTCHELHESGERHNVWRYIRILKHQNDELGEAKRKLIYRGIADAFEEYGSNVHQYQSAISESQAIENAIAASLGDTTTNDSSGETKQEEDGRKPSSPTRMLNHMAESGHGLEIIHEYVKGVTAYEEDTQVEVYRLFTVAAKAYCNESARGEEEVLTLMLDQLQAFRSLYSAIKSGSTPERALVHILKPFSFLGKAPRVQSGARDSGVLQFLGNLLLSENVEVQSATVTALKMLQDDCLENRRVLTQANVPFLMCPLLQSSNNGVREAAAAALAQFVHATKHEEMSVAEQTKEALASADCIPTLKPLLQSNNDKLKMNALRVLHALSGSPKLVPKMIDAGVVPPTVAMLTQPNASDELLEKAARIICNVAITNKEVRARVHGAGGLAIAVQLLKSPKPTLRSCACELVNTFSADQEAQVILRDSNAVETLLHLLSTGNDRDLIDRSQGFGIYAADALSKMLSTATDIGYSHRITAVQTGAGQTLSRLLQTCRELLKRPNDMASGAILARHVAASIDSLGREAQSLGAMYLGGSQGNQALGSLVTGLLQVLMVILELSQTSATVFAASEIVKAVGSLCGASLPRAAMDPMMNQQLQHAMSAAAMARQHVAGRQGVEYFMPLLAKPMVSTGGQTGENMRLNALRALLIIVGDEVACGGRSRQVQHLTAMADSGAIEVVAKKLQSVDKGQGLDAFSLMCGADGRAAYGNRHQSTMQQCVRSVAQCLTGQPMNIVAQATSILRDLSSDSGNWAPIKQYALAPLAKLLQMTSHLQNTSCDSTAIVVDAATTIAHMAVLEEHCMIVFQHGGMACLAWLITVQNNQQLQEHMRHAQRESLLIVAAALNALGALCTSSAHCRQAAVQEGLFTRVDQQSGQKVIGPVLMLLAQTVPSLEGSEVNLRTGSTHITGVAAKQSQNGANVSGPASPGGTNNEDAVKKLTIQSADRALYCVEAIAKDPRTRVALVDSEASMNLILQLPKTSNRELRGRAMAVVLQVVHDGSSAAVVWHNVRQQGDINLAFELLAVGDSSIKAQACAAIKALSTPAIPGQAPQVTAAELVRRGVGPTLIGVLADKSKDDGARKAQACAAECLYIMTGSEESHVDLIANGIAAALPIVLNVVQIQPKAEIINLNSALQITKNLCLGNSCSAFWSALSKLNVQVPKFPPNTTPLGLYFDAFSKFLNDPKLVISGETPDAAKVLASIPLDILSDHHVVGHILRVGLPKTLVHLVGNDQSSDIRLSCLKALEKLVQHVALARALCNENAVPVVLEMLRVPNESDQTRQELAAMLAALTKSDPVRVAESMVSPNGMAAIKLMLGSDQAARTQVSIVGILASMAKGSAAVRVKVCEAALEAGPTFERALVTLGADISDIRNQESLLENVTDEKNNIEPSKILRTETVDILYSGIIDDEENKETKEDHTIIANSVVETTSTTPTSTTRPMAITALRHLMILFLHLGELDANRRTLCDKSPHLIDAVVGVMSLKFDKDDGDCSDIKIKAMKAFGLLSLAAPIVGTDYGAWRKGYDTLIKVPANSATSTENELTASLDALRSLLSVYPEIAIDVPALLKVVGPMAIVATAKDLKIAGLQLLVQMLSSHDLVEKAFGYGTSTNSTDRQKLVQFTEQLVTDLERLRDGMAPSLAALQGGGNDLLCMWSLLTLRALCANVGFRQVLLSSHSVSFIFLIKWCVVFLIVLTKYFFFFYLFFFFHISPYLVYCHRLKVQEIHV
jgi:hypothetical protein